MTDRSVAAAWEALRLVNAWHRRGSISTADGWLDISIDAMWLSGDPPETTLSATWRAEQDEDVRETAISLWNPDGSPGTTGLTTQIAEDARSLDVAHAERPVRDITELDDLFEASCAVWVWQTLYAPGKRYPARRVGLIGAHPETQVAIEFPTPNGLEELRSDIWQEPGRPAAASQDLAFDLWIRFIEGG